MLVTLAAGSLVGALIAWWLGALLAPGVDPASVGATAADSIVIAPPRTDTILVVFAQPAIAAAVYTFLVAWNGHPDWPSRHAAGGRNAANGSVTRYSLTLNRYIAAGRPPAGPVGAVVPVGSSIPRRVRMRCRLVGSTSCSRAVA